MQMRHPIYAFALFLLLSLQLPLSAQGYYSFTVDSGAYQELANPSLLSTIPDTNGYYIKVPFSIEAYGIPFSFEQEGTIFVFTSGFVGAINGDSARLCSFDAFVADMRLRGGDSSSLSYAIEGSEGERVLKIQWKNMAMKGNPATDYANVQLWLSQKDNSLEVHIGPCRVTGGKAYYGYSGPAIGSFLASPDLTTYYDTYHLIGNPAKPDPERHNAYYPMNGTPGEGTIYRLIYMRPASVASVAGAGGIAIYPNPTAGLAQLQLPETLSQSSPTLILSDMLGREALRVESVASGDRIDIGALSDGVYLVTLREGGRMHSGGSLIIRR